LKDYEQYPKDKLAEIETILAEEIAKDKAYTDALTEADAALNEKEYDNAIAAYQKALGVKPTETYPQGKIEEAKRLKTEQKQLEENYKQFIANADAAMTSKDYANAKSNFEQASALKTEEKYPKDKLIEIKGLMDAAAQLDTDYSNFIKEGDKTLAAKDYDAAKEAFDKALALKAQEQYPKDKLTEIETALARLAKEEEEKKAKEEAYQKIITAADGLLASKKYEEAKGKYEEALAVKAEEQYPKDKIKEVEGLIADLAKEEADKKAKEEKYLAVIAEADGLLSSQKYEEAKGKYEEALTLKAEEQYPKDKIKSIEETLATMANLAAEKEAKEAQYLALIAEADNLFGSKSFEAAKAIYTQALEVKSQEQYPADQLKEIEKLLAEIARKKAEEEAAKLAGEEREAKYQEAIVAADKSFDSGNYDAAKLKYNEALGIKTDEQYPKDKLKAIEDALAEIAKKKAEEEAAKMAGAEKDKKYQEAITLADNALGFENYDQAKLKYNEALAVKPDEQYPKDKLLEVEAAIAALAKKNEEDALAKESERKKQAYFEAVVAEGDAELAAKKYDEAALKYNQALGIIPGEKYPTDKLKEITDILAKIEAEKANANLAKAELDKKYTDLIASADNSFSAKDYSIAKASYQSALGLKPSEQYPNAQIIEIDRLLAEIAAKEKEITLTANAQKQKEADYDALITNADSELSGKNYNKAMLNYQSALGLMPDKAYPKDKIDEIKRILADLAAKEQGEKAAALAEKQKKEDYDKLIFDGNRSMKLKEYTNAKVSFTDALALYPNEKYPQDKLAKITSILEELSKPKEVMVSKSTMIGGRAKINKDKELEIEAKMAKLLGKITVLKDEALQRDKEEFNSQEEIRVSAAIERTKDAKESLKTREDGNLAIAEIGNEFHKENSEMLDAGAEMLNKAEASRIKKADKRRTKSDNELKIYNKQQTEFTDVQEKLSIEKADEHYIYVNDVQEGELLMVEKGEQMRAVNKVNIEELAKADAKRVEASEKRAEESTVDIHQYKEELAEGEVILVDASINRTEKNRGEIKELSESLVQMNSEKINYYKLNVTELTDFKERIAMLEVNNIERADGIRENNQRINDKYLEDMKRTSERQNQKYYDDVADAGDYQKEIAQYELALEKEAGKRRLIANKEVLRSMDHLSEVDKSQEKRYESFKTKLDQQKQNNDIFLADLQSLEQEKIKSAKQDLKGFYIGEKRVAEDEELAAKYPQGITEETVESGNSIVIRRTKVTDKHADVYERVFYTWGGTYFYKNGKNITQSLWDKESID